MISGQTGIKVAGEAANGREAFELARQLLPDVIVMDISMPVMDGIEATQLGDIYGSRRGVRQRKT